MLALRTRVEPPALSDRQLCSDGSIRPCGFHHSALEIELLLAYTCYRRGIVACLYTDEYLLRRRDVPIYNASFHGADS